MGFRLLSCVALCLLGPGSVDSGVTQTPRHVIKARGQTVTLRCSPLSGHLSVLWYQQAQGQGPQFLIQYYNKEESARGSIPDRFTVQQLDDYSMKMTMSSLEPTDSARYLCASSQDTALQSHFLPVHKPPRASTQPPQS